MKLKLPLLSRRVSSPRISGSAEGDGVADGLSPAGDMSFLDHLEDLRWTLIKGAGGILVMTVLAAFFSDWIVRELLMGPAKADFFMYKLFGIEAKTLVLQSRNPTGQFFAHMGIILAVGVVLGSPVAIFSLWRFIEPGLYPNEKSGMRYVSFFATFFFILGLSFGYCVTTPFALQFFNNYVIDELIVNEFDITRYFSMVTWWAFGAGILFELPVVIYFLAKLGLATPGRLRKSRYYAWLAILTASAFLTPPDPGSMIIVSVPMALLYECSIFVAAYAIKRRERELKVAWGDVPDPASKAGK